MSTRLSIWVAHFRVMNIAQAAFTSLSHLWRSIVFLAICYLGHMLGLRHDRIVRQTIMAMLGGGNRSPEGSLFVDCQGSELKDIDTPTKNHTAWRNKVAILVI